MLLDGHSLAYRAFYALPVENFSTVDGRSTNAVYGFVSMLLNTLRDEKPTHVAVAFDLSRQTFRSAEFPEYKANRAASPAEFKPQIGLIQEVLEALGIQVVTAEGFEADDVIATLARQAAAADQDVLILTGDRDALQLVDNRITVLYPRKGVSDLARMTPAEVEGKYGVRPDQYADFAALRGDPSDNLPGIPGVGEKTAAKWIQQFGSVNALADRVDEVPGKAGASLREHLASVLLNRRLTQLVDDVPLPVGVDDLERVAGDRQRIDELFDALEFRVLRDRLDAALPGAAPAPVDDRAVSTEGELLEPGALATWLADHRDGPLGLHADGLVGRGTGRAEVIAWATQAEAAAVVVESMTPADRSGLQSWAQDSSQLKAVHDLNATSLMLTELGVDLAGVTMDTQLAAYLLAPDARGYELDLLTRTRLDRSLVLDDDASSDQLAFDTTGPQEGAGSARASARAVHALSELLAQDCERRGVAGLMRDLELPLTSVIVAMERTGIAVDRPGLVQLAADFDRAANAAIAAAHEIVGHPVNLASPKQLQTVLFDELGMPKTKRTKTGYSTDAESLASLLEQTGHPFLQRLMEHRDAAKLRSTVEGLIATVDVDGRIRTTLRQTIAATGRLSSTEPNLQNIPVRTADGRRIRACFVVGEGYASLMTADYSQIEMRIMAHLSKDEGLIAAFTAGEDLHSTMAASVFGVAPTDVDAEMRRKIKAMSYGLAYGLSAFGLAKQLGTSNDEARVLMDTYFERFGGVRDYLDGVVDQARSTGYTETIMGRRRYLPDLMSDNRQRREAAERMALNAPIQGSAADLIKKAMLDVHQAFRTETLQSRLLLQVHDELVVEVAEGEADRVEALLRQHMGGAYALAVPLDVSVGTGSDWDAAAH
jgi:DNA polymerase-1